MTKTRPNVPHVPGLCRAMCRHFHCCAGCAGSTTCARTHKKTPPHTPHKHAHMRIYTRHTRHTRHMLDSYTHFHASPGTRAGTPSTPFIFIFKRYEDMDENRPQATRTIRCTPENAREMQQMVKAWPALHALVQDLQAQDLFPGLRALTVTVTGAPELVAKGLSAVAEINAPQRD